MRRISLAAAAALVLLALVDGGVALARGTVRAPIDLPWSSPPLAAALPGSGLGPASPNAMWDVATQMIPWRSVVARAYAEGEWPLWNPYAAAGEPLAGSGQSAPYHPFLLLSLLLPAPQALSYLAAVKLFAAALAMFLLARELGLDERVAVVVAAGWAFCGYVHAFQGWPIGYVAAAFPLLLLGARRAVRAPGAHSALLLLTGFALTVLAGHPESALFALTGAGVWFLAELAVARGAALGRALATGALSAVAALGLTAFFWLPFWDTVRSSAEHAARLRQGSGPELASLPVAASLERLRPHAVPFAGGLPIFGVPEPRGRLAETAGTAFPGAVLLGAAAYGLAAGRRRWRLPLAAAGLAGLALTTRLAGVVEPLRRLPLFDVAVLRDAQLWTALAVVLAAGFGLERASAGARGRRLAAAWLATAAALGALTAAWWPAILASGLPERLAQAHAAVLVAAPLAAALALAAGAPARWLPLVLALALLERRVETAPLAHRYEARFYFPLVAPLDRLPAPGAPYRIAAGHAGLLPANYAAVYGFEDLRTYSPLTLPRLLELAELWREPGEHPLRAADLASPALALLDVRYALGADCAGLPPGWRRLECANGVALLERERPLGRAFVPARLRWGGTADERLRGLREATDPGRLAWLEAEDGPLAGEAVNGRCELGEVRSGFRPRVETSCREPAWVVVSMAAWPGWQAFAAGRALPVAIADHALVAFEAPAGRSTVDLVYRPRSFRDGGSASALAAVALALWGAARALRSRRARGALSRPSRSSG